MAVAHQEKHLELPPLLGWLLAPASIALAFAANELIPQGIFPAPFFVAAIMITAHFGGRGPALLAFSIGGLTLDYFYVPPFGHFDVRSDLFPSLLQFIVPSALGAWFIEKRKDVERLLRRETEVARRLQGEQSLNDIGKSVLEYLAPELGAPIASFYTVELDGSAQRRASYAFDVENAPATVAPGQGAVGQAISVNRTQVLSVPPDYVTVRSSLGAKRPSCVVIVPAGDGERVHAVLELGFFRRVDTAALQLLARIAEPLAIGVRASTYRTRLQELLEETRRQAEELKSHDEELRTVNEELEERGRAMSLTQRKLEEQQVELEQTNETLRDQAHLLGQQNEELAEAHEAVRLKSEDAERANRAKSEFLANMSHELRTPLNSSLILAKLLTENRDGNLSSEQIRFAETIYSAGNDLLAMIDDILDLAKVESGKVELSVEELSLNTLAEDLRRTFEPIAKERGLEFSIKLEDLPPSFRSDKQRLSQILKNLLSNAFKFTSHGGVSLLIGSDGTQCRFVVRDSGIGIASTQVGAIFEAFRQADGTTNRKYGGTGLGLSISRDLARLLGGEIHVTSVVAQGSTFTLAVPLTFAAAPSAPLRAIAPREASAASGPVPASRPAAERPSAASRPSAILIIEDDARFSEIVAALARELNFEPTIAATADEAIELAIAHPPDGIVLDMKLPDHSGLSVLDSLKRDPRTRHIPVHVISVENHTRTALEMGAIGYMLKPVERAQIKAALQKLEGKFTRSLRRLLVVEDDLVQRDAICQLLGGNNVEIIAVATVQEALEQLRSSSFDCVVTDLALPDGSGYDLLQTMATDESYSFPSVVVYTGRSLSMEEEQRLRQYSQSIIVKGARSPERLLDEVTLFLHQVESALPPERQRMLRRVRHREAVFEDRSILVVEDDVRNVFALTNVLEPKGMKVTVARNGLEALEALERDPKLELVLMDIMMPEMDGIEATRAIRKQTKWAKLPIIALTAKAMKDDQQRCLEAGANDYIPKPLDVEMLLSLLRVWIPK
jgi:CheY-like chemotaxis protein/signal transduction histidine kinase